MSDIYNNTAEMALPSLIQQFCGFPNIPKYSWPNDKINAQFTPVFAHNIYVCVIDTVNKLLLH